MYILKITLPGGIFEDQISQIKVLFFFFLQSMLYLYKENNLTCISFWKSCEWLKKGQSSEDLKVQLFKHIGEEREKLGRE